MRKAGLALVGLVLVAAIGFWLGRASIARVVIERLAAQNIGRSIIDDLPDGLHVVLCGAGSPLPDPARAGPCIAVIAGKRLFIVDVGAGSPRNLARMRIGASRVEGVFLTHFHSDHIDGLGELMMQRWVNGAHTTPLPVHGPEGVAEVVNGLNLAYRQDATYRVAHHGPETVPPGGAGGRPYPFTVPGDGRDHVVLDDAGLEIRAFRVDHEPIRPAVGYRFDYAGRSVVISGDTTKNVEVARASQGVDLLAHEALSMEIIGLLNRASETAGAENLAKITGDILDYHTSPVQAAEIARDARVGHLLFYHIVPPMLAPGTEALFLEGVDDVFPDHTLGTDGTMVHLPAGSHVIEVETLL